MKPGWRFESIIFLTIDHRVMQDSFSDNAWISAYEPDSADEEAEREIEAERVGRGP